MSNDFHRLHLRKLIERNRQIIYSCIKVKSGLINSSYTIRTDILRLKLHKNIHNLPITSKEYDMSKYIEKLGSMCMGSKKSF